MSSTGMSAAANERIFLNGVDALSGAYLTAPVTPEELLDLARAEFRQTSSAEQQFTKTLSYKRSQPHLGFDVHSLDDLSEARWGVVFATDEDERVKRALQPLIKHRADQLGFAPTIFEYKSGWTSVEFLANNGVGRGLGEVEKVPYYLLIVGDPTKIPFRLQYELDAEYATGRLCFDASDGYAAYIECLIDYETTSVVPSSREAMFWATANDGDRSTLLSSQLLVRPLFDRLNMARGFNRQLSLGPDTPKPSFASPFT